MKKMSEIKNLNDKDLNSLIEEKREEVRKARFGSTSRDVKAVKAAKKEIARALTLLGERGRADRSKEVAK
jgi:ribosomal protein L29